MIAALVQADAVTWVSILVKTLAYAATLVAAGSVLVSMALRELTAEGQRALRRLAAIAAVAAALLSVLRVPVAASYLTGGLLEGAFDPMMLGLVADSPLGVSVSIRFTGLALILAILLPVRGAKALALAGALITCASFAFRGHTLGDPRLLLGTLVTLHMAGLAFWLGAFAPLARATRSETPAKAGALAQEFGAKAFFVVAALVLAGAVTLLLLGVTAPEALATPYGQGFVVKLALFAGVLGLAAWNKIRLTPGLLAEMPGSARRLRWSIGLEGALILVILATTAALTTVTSPPSEAARISLPEPRTLHGIGTILEGRADEVALEPVSMPHLSA